MCSGSVRAMPAGVRAPPHPGRRAAAARRARRARGHRARLRRARVPLLQEECQIPHGAGHTEEDLWLTHAAVFLIL